MKTFKCFKCGAIALADEPPRMCTAHSPFRTSGICGGIFYEMNGASNTLDILDVGDYDDDYWMANDFEV